MQKAAVLRHLKSEIPVERNLQAEHELLIFEELSPVLREVLKRFFACALGGQDPEHIYLALAMKHTKVDFGLRRLCVGMRKTLRRFGLGGDPVVGTAGLLCPSSLSRRWW